MTILQDIFAPPSRGNAWEATDMGWYNNKGELYRPPPSKKPDPIPPPPKKPESQLMLYAAIGFGVAALVIIIQRK